MIVTAPVELETEILVPLTFEVTPVFWKEKIFDEVLKLMPVEAFRVMVPVRLPKEPYWYAARCGGPVAGLSALMLAPWAGLVKRRLRAAGLLHNDQIFGVAASGAMTETRVLEVLARLPPGITEIYLHPAVESGAAIAPSMAGYRHEEELAALLSPRVRAAITAVGAACGGFRDAGR